MPTIVRHSVDAPKGVGPFQFTLGGEIAIAGWAFLEPARSIPSTTALEVINVPTGTRTRVEAQRQPRPDVARHFGADSLLMAGFACTFRVDARFLGDNQLRLLQVDDQEAVHAVDLFSFEVVAAVYETHARTDLAARFLRGAGIEIGALQRRLRVPAHCSVTYVDRMSLADLLVHYPELRGQSVQPPDLIDDGETLARIGDGSQDFVIANHFLEHCENPIQTLLNFARVLNENGILYMAVPDKRLTFDVDRPITSYSALAETFRTGVRRDREALYIEWAAIGRRGSPSELRAIAQQLSRDQYSIHFNVWSLDSLLQFLIASRLEFDVPLSLEWVVCSENEAIVILKKQDTALKKQATAAESAP